MHIKICEKGSILSHFYVAFLFFINILLPFFLLSLSDSLSLVSFFLFIYFSMHSNTPSP